MAWQPDRVDPNYPPNMNHVSFRFFGRTLPVAALLLSAALGSAQTGSAPAPASTAPASPAATPSTQTPALQPAPVVPAPAPPAGSSAAPMGSNPQTAPAAAQPASAGSAVADSARYIIGAEDVLQITVWNEQKMSGAVPVRPDGMISIPLIGDLPAAGKTPMQLGSDISEQAKKYIQDPNVTVVVTAVNSQRVFLVGEVTKVGPVALTPGMTPLQAISAAGGPGPFASVKKIYILRGTGAHQQKIPFNYKQAIKGDNRGDVELHPGDTIVIP